MKPNITFTGTKLSFKINVKDPVSFTKNHGKIYRSVCATENCNEDYVGEFARLYEPIKDRNGCSHSSDLVKHAGNIGQVLEDTGNFIVIGSHFQIP